SVTPPSVPPLRTMVVEELGRERRPSSEGTCAAGQLADRERTITIVAIRRTLRSVRSSAVGGLGAILCHGQPAAHFEQVVAFFVNGLFEVLDQLALPAPVRQLGQGVPAVVVGQLEDERRFQALSEGRPRIDDHRYGSRGERR